jgi:hypothetical protein
MLHEAIINACGTEYATVWCNFIPNVRWYRRVKDVCPAAVVAPQIVIRPRSVCISQPLNLGAILFDLLSELGCNGPQPPKIFVLRPSGSIQRLLLQRIFVTAACGLVGHRIPQSSGIGLAFKNAAGDFDFVSLILVTPFLFCLTFENVDEVFGVVSQLLKRCLQPVDRGVPAL